MFSFARIAVSAVVMLATGGNACSVVGDIDELCAAFSIDTCALWVGDGSVLPGIDRYCEVKGAFELTCAAASVLATDARLTVRALVGMRVTSCSLSGDIIVEGVPQGSQWLEMRDTSADGALRLRYFNSAIVDGLSVRGSLDEKPALRFAFLPNVTATTITVTQAPLQEYPLYAGCVDLVSSTLNVDSLSVRGCTAHIGGGLVGESATVNAGTVLLENCTAFETGGGASLLSSTLNARTLTVRGCSAVNGGGIFATELSTMTVGTGAFIQNTATESGGGLSATMESSLTFTSLTVALSKAAGQGGGVSLSKSSLQATTFTARCNAAALGHDLACRFSPTTVSVATWETDVDDSLANPADLVANCPGGPASGTVFTNAFTAGALPAPFFDNVARVPSRGGCADTCVAVYPNGYSVKSGSGSDLLSHTLAAAAAAFDAAGTALPLSLAGIPLAVSEGASLHQTTTGGMPEGDSLELACCAGGGACEFFVSLYSCVGCAGVVDGLWPSLMHSAEWQKGSCAPAFAAGPAEPDQPMKTFRVEVDAGAALSVPVAGGDALAFAVFARRANPVLGDWCPAKVHVGPQTPPTCSANCYA
ncbi:hypothetical protein DIPPA_16697 [Diplonema papillatum]|nr:hypothetical protein DIPPA_16697 [Diplonema papillatum]